MTNFRIHLWLFLIPTLASAWSRTTSTLLPSILLVPGKYSSTSLNMSSDNKQQQPIRILGVCGGIGSGKSLACQLLVSDLGCISHIEADSIAHTVYKPGSQAIYDVVEKFGPDILLPDKAKGEEEIDRKKLGAIAFSDPSAMSTLEHIVWPHVKTEILAQIKEIKAQHDVGASSGEENEERIEHPVIVLEAAVLLDAGWDDLLDAVWVVRAPHKVAVERLVEYRSFTTEDAEKRIEAQKTRRGIGNLEEEFKNGVVTAIIENTKGVDELKEALLEKLQDSNAWKKGKCVNFR